MTDHDSIYHRLFSHPEMVAELLRDFLDAAILAELDLSGMKRLNTKFTAMTGHRRRGDMVWEIPTRSGNSLFVLLILEFQSEVDEWMALRLDVYSGLLYQQLVDERKLKAVDGLPPVLPIVLYNGETRWQASTSLRDLIRLPSDSPLWQYQPEMRYYTIDEGQYPEEDLRGCHSLVAIFIRLQHPVSPESILAASRAAVQWFAEHPEGPPVKRLFRELLTTGLARLKEPSFTQPVPEGLEEVVPMLARYVEKWERDIRREGHKKGERDGEAHLLTRLLQRRFGTVPDWVSKKVADADQSLLEEWGLRVLDAESLEEVFRE
ncbi:MAG: Rpn family recombination-promoting nuclease/putative transposase [Magnetococcales bacterium]|nr:Rpn family recombination-promoting nuclease/putative transposase [Magnetococcales bacterium]